MNVVTPVCHEHIEVLASSCLHRDGKSVDPGSTNPLRAEVSRSTTRQTGTASARRRGPAAGQVMPKLNRREHLRRPAGQGARHGDGVTAAVGERRRRWRVLLDGHGVTRLPAAPATSR